MCTVARPTTRAVPASARAPVTDPRHARYTLKTLLIDLCLLFVATQAAGAAHLSSASSSTLERGAGAVRAVTPPYEQRHGARSLDKRLERKLRAARKYRSIIHFFDGHRWLLTSADHRAIATTALRQATRDLARANRNIAAIRRVLRRREARRLLNAPPTVAICNVFGGYCGQALSVAWCESRHSTTAQNGQYLGLFQMGSHERQTYGHGETAQQQAVAAHRYFVLSGRDWSPWSCKPSVGWAKNA
jgi:hypothetical protein